MRSISLSLLIAATTVASLVAVQAVPAGAQITAGSQTVQFADGSVHFVAGSSWSITDGTSNITDGTSNTIGR